MDGGGVTRVADARSVLAGLFRRQAAECERGGSPLYADLLVHAADDLEQGGPVWTVLQGVSQEARRPAIALQFMRGVHRVVLEGRAPELARYFPSAGGTERGDAWPAFEAAVESHADELAELTRPICQTNEVGRASALLPGFLLLARRGLPLRLLECGASAGLILWWDRFRYEASDRAWGDPGSPVRFRDVYEPPRPPLTGEVVVANRRGCDPNPLDPRDPEHHLQLVSSVWADQTERLRALEGAIAIATREGNRVERAGAIEWLPERLTESAPGVMTVVYHTVMLPWMSDEERERLPKILEEFGARATAAAPLAWLRMEPYAWPEPFPHQVRLTEWPGGEERVLARSGAHGRPVWWLPGEPPEEPPLS